MGHLEKHDAHSPPSPPKYLENREKSEKNNKKNLQFSGKSALCTYNRLLRKLQILLFFSLFSRFQGIFGGGGREGRERRVFPGGPCWSQTICIHCLMRSLFSIRAYLWYHRKKIYTNTIQYTHIDRILSTHIYTTWYKETLQSVL